MNNQNSGKGDGEGGGGSSIESESSDGLGAESSKYDVEGSSGRASSSKPSSSSNKSESSDGLGTKSSFTKDEGERRGRSDKSSARPASASNNKATAHRKDEKAKYKKNPNIPKRRKDDTSKIVPGYTASAKTTGLNTERQPVQAPGSAVAAAATTYPGTIHQRNLPGIVNVPRMAAAAPAPSQHGLANSATTDEVVQQATRQALQTAVLLQLLQQVHGPTFGMNNERQATTQQASQQPSPVQVTNPQQSQPQLDNSLQAVAQWALSRLQQQGGNTQNMNVPEETKSNGPAGSAGSASNNALAGQFGRQGQTALPLGMLGPLLSVSLNGTASSEIPHRFSPNPPPSPPPQAVTNEQAAMLGRLVLASFQNQQRQQPPPQQQQQQNNVAHQGGRGGIPQAAAAAAPSASQPQPPPPPPNQQANQNLNILTNLVTQGGFSAAGIPANALSGLLDPTAMFRMAMQTLQQQQQGPQQPQAQQQQQAPAPSSETIQLLALTHLYMTPPSDENNSSNNNQGNDSNRPNQGS